MTGEPRPVKGGTTPGVERAGDTVRRPGGPWTKAVNALLVHLEAHDFPAPRPLGIDDEGRQVVSWLPGETSWLDHARHWGSVARLRAAARLVRHLHDVLDQFVPPGGAVWRGGWDRDTGGQGPICHHDLAPWNVIVAPDRSLAVI